MRARRMFLAPVLAVSLLLTGCGGDEEESPEEPGETQSSAAAPEEPNTWPLTGLRANGEGGAEKDHPVMVVKIDNTAGSAPQKGVSKADLVVEELVEGNMTRLAVMYYSQIPGTVGPLRSMRASDIGIVSPIDGTMVTSGAAKVTARRIEKAGIEVLREGAKGFFRDNGRSAPYNLYTNLRETTSVAKLDEPTRPVDYLPWGSAGDLPQGQPANTIAVDFGRHVTEWQFKDGRYVNENSYAAQGDRFEPETVLALRVRIGDAGYRDPAGNFVPETKFTGKGEAMLFHDGRVVRGTWSKQALDAPLELATKAGKLTVPAGKVWIELVPIQGGNVSFGR